ncbi:MAG: hypothetical protein GTN78_04420 [Gemmatimonadales bacterium]|nr:hypothetical protein [Gemmatimonadales bacterium]NIQ99431.1 hypothetical protein [Gemmatimonadales bacterium]NIS64099.1 hypothetical protein [Gemmatimonadales bacterium]
MRSPLWLLLLLFIAPAAPRRNVTQLIALGSRASSQQVPDTGVVVGSGLFNREKFFQNEELKGITAITLGSRNRDSLVALTVGGHSGAAFQASNI